jgi:hypothetical protein
VGEKGLSNRVPVLALIRCFNCSTGSVSTSA